jgi:hypothetical protein
MDQVRFNGPLLAHAAVQNVWIVVALLGSAVTPAKQEAGGWADVVVVVGDGTVAGGVVAGVAAVVVVLGAGAPDVGDVVPGEALVEVGNPVVFRSVAGGAIDLGDLVSTTVIGETMGGEPEGVPTDGSLVAGC